MRRTHPRGTAGFRFGLTLKIWLGVGLTFAVAFLALQLLLYRSMQEDALNALRLEAGTLGRLLMISGEVFHRTLIDSGLPMSGDHLDLLPTHAVARISQDLRSRSLETLSIRVVTREGSTANERPDPGDRADMDYFERHREASERLTRSHEPAGEMSYRYSQPIWTQGYCLTCHGSAEQVPESIRHGHAPALGYKEGDLRAILSIRLPGAPIDQRLHEQFVRSLLGHLLVFSLLFLAVGLLLQRFVINRLGHLQRLTHALAGGDYGTRVTVAGNDELADLGIAFNRMADQIAQRDQQLAANEEQLRLFIEHAPVALAMVDRDMRYLAVSQRWISDYRLGTADIIGRSHYELFPETPDHCKTAHRRGLAGEVVQAGEHAFAQSDGGLQWQHWEVRPWYQADGVLGGIVIFTEDITARKEAEQALERANRHHRGLLEASLDPLVVIDRNGRISDVNAATEQATGYGRGQLLGTEFAEYFSNPAQARAGYLRAFDQGQVRDYALELRHRDGWTTPVRYNATLYRDPDGSVEEVFAAARDVTALQRITSLLEARLRMLENLADRSLEELLRHTLDEAAELTESLIGFYHFLESDQRTLSLQAWSTRTLAEFCQAEGSGMHYPLDQAGVWADCARHGQPIIHNDYAKLPNRKGLPAGHAKVIRELVVPVMRDERIVAILGVGNKARDYDEADVQIVSTFADLAWDLVERKRDQEALSASEARYRRIVETASEGVWILDVEQKTSFVNTRMAAMLGTAPDAILGRPCTDFFFDDEYPEHGRLAYERHLARRQGGQTEHYEQLLRRDDGSRLWVLVSASPILNEDRSFGGSLCMLTDISLLKTQQQRLEQMAHYDALTALPNRILLADRLQLALAHARRHQCLLAVCYLDLDGFKQVNDTHGHAAGDRLLCEIARRFTRTLRAVDTAARLGGDEFVILLGDLQNAEQCQATLERLLTLIAEPYAVDPTHDVSVSASIGVTLYPLDQSDADTLLRHADQAMYQAKHAGRGRIQYSDASSG